ncbi:ribonuclease HIII [Rummeliibacillus pycnus]|uniref:ribonuclease HIII n=1 Tax=Rummeliibacillus pycnus TaxID=101070 RepID=UPI000C9C571B|nr:ribonuclease HIII [Rummeliibacillus pycnus]
MSNIVIKLPPKMQKEVMNYYSQYIVERKAPGVIFAAKLADCAITIYSSGKVMFQGGGCEREAEQWKTQAEDPSTMTLSKGDTLPNNLSSLSVIGSDETGTGDYFGPITVAAVYVPQDKIDLVKELGVKDSKLLTDDYMLKIASDLKATLPHCVLVLHNEKYNLVQAAGTSQGKMKAQLHNQAIRQLLAKIAPEKPEYILIDQFAERKTYYNYLKTEKEIVTENVLFATKAEQIHVAVAAASILARCAFLSEMDKLSKSIGVTLPKGASHRVDEIAAQILLAQGEESLHSVTKWHFANTQKASRIASKKRFN